MIVHRRRALRAALAEFQASCGKAGKGEESLFIVVAHRHVTIHSCASGTITPLGLLSCTIAGLARGTFLIGSILAHFRSCWAMPKEEIRLTERH